MSDNLEALKQKIDAINDRAWTLRNRDVEQARALLEEARTLSTTGAFEEVPYHAGQIRSLTGLGYVHRISGDLDRAMTYLTEAQQLSDATGLLQAPVSVTLGSIYSLVGDFFQSLQAYEKGLSVARHDADLNSEAEALMGIANIHAMRADYSEAIHYATQGFELCNETQYLGGQLRALNNLASLHQLNGNYEDARSVLEKSLSLTDNADFVLEKTFILSTAGEIEFSLGNYRQALSFLQQALNLSEENFIRVAQPGILVNISRVYIEQHLTELEILVLHQAIKVSEELNHFDSQHVCHLRLAAIYEERGDFETALRHYKRFHAIKTIIFDEAADQKLKHMQVLHETETHKQQAEIERLRNAELQQANEVIEAANRAKSAFLAHMSHELRTPINAILGFAQLMQYDPALSTTHHENLRAIVRSGEHLLDLINDVLDMSRIEAAKMTVQPSVFNCHQLLDELASMFDFRVKQKQLTFSVTCNPNVPQWIKTDERKLRQVLLNLIGNAVKFTAVGRVEVRAQYAESRLYFEVEDTGQGIAPADFDTLFTPFHQPQHQESAEQGTGLGLAISQAFVRLMGDGCITVSSELNRGSLFRFDIPIEVAPEQERVEIAPPKRVKALTAGQPPYRILVADDDTDGRTALVRLLKLVGFEVQEAINGKQTVAISSEWHPHVILMDLRMPEMDGYEATQQIKRHNPDIAIIATTSNAFEQANNAEFDGFLLKPLQTDLLFEIIARHIAVRYEYGEAPNVSSRPLFDAAKFRELLRAQSLSWRQRLHHYAIAGNKTQIVRMVGEIDQQHKGLADNLRNLMAAYRFDTLISLLEQDIDTGS